MFGAAQLRSLLCIGFCSLTGSVVSQVDECASCHTDYAASERDRAHQRAGVTCVDCHGGDSSQSDKERAKAAETGYRGVLERRSFPGLCGDCHADVRRMNPFGIPTDQLAQYRTSVHGETLFEDGDDRVATCVDCHGSHGIEGARSTESPIHPRNIPTTCARCHSDPEIVEEYGLDGDEEQAYRESVHGELLFEDGDLSAPQCATCHGNHGAVPPGFGSVGDVCGKCHIREKELFDQSPHARLVAEGEFGACVSCHGNHRVPPAGEEILERACGLCHGEGDRAITLRDRLLRTLRSTREDFEAARANVEIALREGFATEDDQVLLAEARASLLTIRTTQHTLDLEQLEVAAKNTSSTLARLNERIESTERIERLKRASLLPVVLFLFLMSFGFWLRYRRIHRLTGGKTA